MFEMESVSRVQRGRWLPARAAQACRSNDVFAQLYRPVVFLEPDRVVSPPSWLEHVPFAFWLVDALRPETFVELGTQSGNSYAAFAQAIQSLHLSTACYAIDTWKGDAHTGPYDESVLAEWRDYHDARFSAFSRLVRATFSDAAEHFGAGSIDLLHLDGCHSYEAVEQDFETWLPKMSPRGVVLLHDINVREGEFGAWRLWQRKKDAYPSFTFLHGHGLGVLGVGSELPSRIGWFLTPNPDPPHVGDIRQFFSSLGRQISRAHNERVLRDKVRDLEQAVRDEREHHERTAQALAAVREKAQRSLWKRLARAARALQGTAAVSAMAVGSGSLRSRAGNLVRFVSQPSRVRDAYTIARSGLFDTDYYLQQSPDVAESRVNPIVHYVFWGAFEGRRPNRLFDPAYYLANSPDIAEAGLEPLSHFLRLGGAERRNPGPHFDCDHYLGRNADVRIAGINPLVHFVHDGWREGRTIRHVS